MINQVRRGDDPYVDAHQASLEKALSAGINETFARQPDDPIAYLASILSKKARSAASAARSPNRAKLVLSPLADETSSGDWALNSWVKGVGTHRVIAAAIAKEAKLAQTAKLAQRANPGDDDAAALAYLRGLTSRDEVAQLMWDEAVIESLIDVVWDEAEMLKKAGAATNKEVEGKFADAIGMEYKGLEAYFGGLEGVVGGPNPKIREGMAAEHLSGSESDKCFTTGNYGVLTTSKAEWLFVTDDDEAAALAKLGRESWPAESEEKLPDHSLCRKWRSLAHVKRAAEAHNERLLKAKHTKLIIEELIAAIMYTGPVFCRHTRRCPLLPCHLARQPSCRMSRCGRTRRRPDHHSRSPPLLPVGRCSSSTIPCFAGWSPPPPSSATRWSRSAARRRPPTRTWAPTPKHT